MKQRTLEQIAENLEETNNEELDVFAQVPETSVWREYLGVVREDLVSLIGKGLGYAIGGGLPQKWQLALERKYEWFDADEATSRNAWFVMPPVYTGLAYGVAAHLDASPAWALTGTGFGLALASARWLAGSQRLPDRTGRNKDRYINGDPLMSLLSLPVVGGEWLYRSLRTYHQDALGRARQRAEEK